MKIAICTTGSSLQANVSPFFGRCSSFLLVDDSQDKQKRKVEIFKNPALEAGRGAGVAASQALVSQKVKAIICGGVGPNAFFVLQSAGVNFYLADSNLTAEKALDQFQKGGLEKILAPIQGRRFGYGRRRGWGRRF